MFGTSFKRAAECLAACCLLIWLISFGAPAVHAQNSNGTLTVTVVDESGAVVPKAQLQLTNTATNDVRSASAGGNGVYSFVDLQYGTYRLSATQSGFQTAIADTIHIETARTTDVTLKLRVGSTTQSVQVTSEASPILEATSNTIGTTIDLKQIQDLPLADRNLNNLSALTPGYTNANGYATFNGLPLASQGNNIDGITADTSRFKDFGNAAAQVTPRTEAIGEMTVLTDQLGLDQGFGSSVMQVNFATKHGGNEFHGTGFENFQNDGLNANPWYSNAIGQPKQKLIINDFGGTLGGPIIKNKLFFFGDYSERKVPGTQYLNNNVFTSAAQQGNFTYVDTNGVSQTVNLLQIAGAAGLQSTVNPAIGSVLNTVNGSTKYGLLRQTGADPNYQTLYWTQPNPTTIYFPVVRIDYNVSDKLRLNGSWDMSDTKQPGAIGQNYPGSTFSQTGGAYGSKYYTAGLGLDWTISPRFMNQFKGGFLYYFQNWTLSASPENVTLPRVLFGYPGGNSWMSGTNYAEPLSNFYPRFDFSDTLTWQRGSHTINFGGSWYREQDHYWNPPVGYPWISMGLANGDPAFNIFTTDAGGTLPNASPAALSQAQQLYAILTGRISAIGGNTALDIKTKQYVQYGAPDLNELQQAWGLFMQDSWRVRPNLTVNYGLRWDFTGDDHDLNGMYHSATPADVYGPSGYGHEFEPGVLTGDQNPMITTHGHQYSPWNVSPQPAIGIAWSPGSDHGVLGALLGSDKTVIRAGYSLRRFTPSYQNFWSYASDYGAFFEGAFVLNPYGTGPGSYTPGTLFLGNSLPPYAYIPTQYETTAPESLNTFTGNGVQGINPNIAQPYVQSWNFGIQRQLGKNSVVEVRYMGNKSTHLWLGTNVNEVNIFENGFLQQFKLAQNNLKINQANGITSFANNGYAGQQALPLFDAAFAGEAAAGAGVPLADYGNGNFIQLLQQGQAGALAKAFAGSAGPQYLCNLVGGNKFSPCAAQGFTGPGAGYPINAFQANPFTSGAGASLLNSIGYSNYNALQIELRQNPWHGLQLSMNYTYGKALGLTGGNGQSGPNQYDNGLPIYTMRDLRLNYGPMPFDQRNVFHLLGTYDLPFGHDKAFLNRAGLLDRVVGGWTLGTVVTYTSGAPFNLLGGFNTFNDIADGGVNLTGLTASQIQNGVWVHHTGNPYAYAFSPSWIGASGAANSAYISPNTTAGYLAPTFWLYGPHFFNTDLSVTKAIPIRENLHFSLQGEFLNAFNHPSWGNPSSSVQSLTFGQIGVISQQRAIELRANIEF